MDEITPTHNIHTMREETFYGGPKEEGVLTQYLGYKKI